MTEATKILIANTVGITQYEDLKKIVHETVGQHAPKSDTNKDEEVLHQEVFQLTMFKIKDMIKRDEQPLDLPF